MNCPRCRAEVKGRPDAAGVIACPSCKAQLKVRVPGSVPPTPAGSITLPPGARAPVPPPASPPPQPASASAAGPASLDEVLGEVKAVRGLQVEILSMLKAMASVTSGGTPAAAPEGDDPFAPPPPVVRTRRRKRVLVIDDDETTRSSAVAALEQAEVPVSTAVDGNAGLESMAADRPDVVVLELGMGGRMGGKDVVNMIKATMEWVDIPIVLYTRVPVDGQKEARLVHGADELVPKGPGAPEALVARVIALFRRG